MEVGASILDEESAAASRLQRTIEPARPRARRLAPAWYVSALIACTLILSSALLAAPPAFEVEDQFEAPHSAASVFARRPVVVLGGSDRHTRDALLGWLPPLRRVLGDNARIVGLVNVDELPFFIPMGTIRGKMRDSFPNTSILLDRDGSVWSLLGFPKDPPFSIRVFDRSGRFLGAVDGTMDGSRLARLAALVPEPAPAPVPTEAGTSTSAGP